MLAQNISALILIKNIKNLYKEFILINKRDNTLFDIFLLSKKIIQKSHNFLAIYNIKSLSENSSQFIFIFAHFLNFLLFK